MLGSMSNRQRYCLITPCRNEEAFARRTLESVVRQSVTPALWVIVDDGSTDQTPQILAEYAEQHDFIRIVPRTDRGQRSVGPGVIEAFYQGYETVDPDAFEFICKLDLDLDLPPRYFETLMQRMEAEPRIGTCSGKPFVEREGEEPLAEPSGSEMSVGMTKFYRVDCFRQIGGFVREVMWDGIDCHRCRMLGWIACSWDDTSDLRFLHLRPMGSSQTGILTGRMRHGFGQYFMGTSFPYICASAMVRMLHPPYVLGGIAIWWGYVRSLLGRKPRYEDRAFRKFLRTYQWSALFRGKARAIARINARQERVWRPGAGSPDLE